MQGLIQLLCILIVVLALIIYYFNRRTNSSIVFLSAYFIIYAIYSFGHYNIFQGQNQTYIAIFWNNFTPFHILAGPSIYFYVRGTLDDGIKWKRSHLLHLLPFLFILIGLIPYLFSSFQYKLEVARLILDDVNNITRIRMNFLFTNFFLYLSRPLLIVTYVVLALIYLIKKVRTNQEDTRQFRVITKWLFIFLSVSLASMIIFALIGAKLFSKQFVVRVKENEELHLIHLITSFIFPLTLILFPQILYGLPTIKTNDIDEKATESNNLVIKIEPKTYHVFKNEEAFKKLGQKILDYFDLEKPYLKPDFTLMDLAKALNVPQHHISYCFSEILNTSFTKLRATKRVENAQKLLLDPELSSRYSIEAIYEMSGFSTRSSFFSSFKEHVGMTPMEFVARNKTS